MSSAIVRSFYEMAEDKSKGKYSIKYEYGKGHFEDVVQVKSWGGVGAMMVLELKAVKNSFIPLFMFPKGGDVFITTNRKLKPPFNKVLVIHNHGKQGMVERVAARYLTARK